jgi:L-lysine 2,3-aminomutase
VSLARGHALVRELQGLVAGPALPRYMLDRPDGLGKVPAPTQALETREADGLHAALYEASSSRTRAEPAGQPSLYLDLSYAHGYAGVRG